MIHFPANFNYQVSKKAFRDKKVISLMEKNTMSRTWLVNCGLFKDKRERNTIAGFKFHALI